MVRLLPLVLAGMLVMPLAAWAMDLPFTVRLEIRAPVRVEVSGDLEVRDAPTRIAYSVPSGATVELHASRVDADQGVARVTLLVQ